MDLAGHVAALAAGLVVLVVLVAGERRAAAPIMPLRLFTSRPRVGAYVARFLYLGAMIGFFYFGTQYLQGVLGFSAFEAGVAFFPMTVVNLAVAMAIPRLTARYGQAIPLAIGVTLTLPGMAWLSQVTTSSSYLSAVALPMLLIGAGQGLAFAPLTSAGIAGVATEDAGAASGMVNTFHQLGMAVGLGVLMTASAHAGRGLSSASAVLTAHVDTALATGSVLLVLCLITALALILPTELRSPIGHDFIGIGGGQAEAIRVPLADGTLVTAPVGEGSAVAADRVRRLPHRPPCRRPRRHLPRQHRDVIGDGAVGLSAVLAAARLSAERIILMGRHTDRTDLGREWDATDVVAERGDEAVSRVLDPTGGDGGPAPVRAYIEELLPEVLDGRLDPGRVFDRTVDLDGVPAGYQAIDNRESLKVMVRP